MTTDTDIRAWLRENGHDVPTRGRLGEEWREVYAAANPDAVMGDNPRLSLVGAEEPEIPGLLEDVDTGEVPPTPPPGLGGKLSAGLKRTPRMKTPRKRVSLEDLAAGAWSLLGNAAGSQGLMPTARVLQMQAPLAGAILEDTLQGTLADRILQPLARTQETASEIVALIGPPILVTAITLQPQRAPMLLPMLRGMMRQWVLIAGPRMKAKEKREAKALKDMGMEADQMDELLDSMVAQLFMEDAAADSDGGLRAA
jgi:hypothetical protein